jgi:hypothetical protein
MKLIVFKIMAEIILTLLLALISDESIWTQTKLVTAIFIAPTSIETFQGAVSCSRYKNLSD